MDIKEFLQLVCLDGGPAVCQFAVSEFKINPKTSEKYIHYADFEESRKALGTLYRNNVRTAVLCGEEPFRESAVVKTASLCREAGINPQALLELKDLEAENISDLISAGISKVYAKVNSLFSLGISEEGFAAGYSAAERALKLLNDGGIKVCAFLILSKACRGFAESMEILGRIGFKHAVLGIAEMQSGCEEELYASADLVRNPDEILDLLNEIEHYSGSCAVVNPSSYWQDLRAYFSGEKQNFVCQGGYKVFYVSSSLNVRRCPSSREVMCSAVCLNGSQFLRDGCTACHDSLFRSLSAGMQAASSFSDGIHSLCFNLPQRAFRQWFDLRNVKAVKYLLSDKKHN